MQQLGLQVLSLCTGSSSLFFNNKPVTVFFIPCLGGK